MRFHVLSLPHVAVNREYCACAYTQKVVKGLKLLSGMGSGPHEITLYGNEGSLNPYGEVVEIFSEAERQSFFGPHDRQKLYDLKWDSSEPYWRLANERCIAALRPRIQTGDFILTHGGYCNKPVADAFPGSAEGIPTQAMFVEWGIGYYGPFSRYRIYESHAHREWMMGRANITGADNDSAVVWNYFDLDEFVIRPQVEQAVLTKIGVEPYYLFVGRLIPCKGLNIVCDTTEELGVRVVFAGQGDGIAHGVPDVLLFGPASIEERTALMGRAVACFAPTEYREPFGGVAVESQLCGTPCITTDHGAFCETVEEVWRCASHREFVAAARRAQDLSGAQRRVIANRAASLFSLEAIAPKYERYFQRLLDRWGDGWFEMEPVRPERILFDRIVREETPQARRIALWMKSWHSESILLDVGCGPGLYVEEMRAFGIQAFGFDSSPDLPDKPYLWRADVTAGEWDLALAGNVVVISFEVGEHIEAEKAESYVDFLTLAKPLTIYFSAAAPGQGGEGHINCQPKEYWVDKLSARGYRRDLETENSWLAWLALGAHMGWLRQNGMVFQRGL